MGFNSKRGGVRQAGANQKKLCTVAAAVRYDAKSFAKARQTPRSRRETRVVTVTPRGARHSGGSLPSQVFGVCHNITNREVLITSWCRPVVGN
jgi:hypothetical protein